MLQKQKFAIAAILIILAAIPATLLLSQKPQDSRSKASASTTLYYTPSTTITTPLQKNIGETVSFDVMVDPGTNLPSIIKLEMNYDSTKFAASTVPFTVNSAAFPTTIEGPVVLDGKVLVSVSIGSDSTKAIQQLTRVGTLTLSMKAATITNTPAVVSFGTKSQILSIATSDQANENVLATTRPAYVSILAAPTSAPTLIAASSTPVPTIAPTSTPVPTNTPVPTATPTPLPTATPIPTAIPTKVPTVIPTNTPAPTATPLPTATLTPHATTLAFAVYLHGIGNSGDNANPTASDFSNKFPLHPSRDVTVTVYNDLNQLVLTQTGLITYVPADGLFSGIIDVGTSLQAGDYTVRIKEGTHLRRLITGIQSILPQQENKMPTASIVAGDINGDNTLNILDYNVIVGCYSDLLPAIDCDDTRKVKSDLNDNGSVNQFDYNLFLREITVQSGN